MSTWNHRLLPHPLLAPWSDDYPGKRFETSVPHAVLHNGKDIVFTVKYNLTSQYLASLISDGLAEFVGILTCSRTAVRNAYRTNQADEVYVVSSKDYSREMRFQTFVIAVKDTHGFISPEHADEFRRFRPEGFAVSQGAILAVGTPKRIELEASGSPFSVIDLVSSSSVGDGLFSLEYEEERIKIYVSPTDKTRIEAIRRRGATSAKVAALFPALYLHAVVEALRLLGNYPESRWAYTMSGALKKHGLSSDPENTRDNAVEYAQKIMERPVGLFLKALFRDEGG
ncbi:MAG: hypothetical protein OXR05_04520 [Gemmatimonadota bacterium]|nr:hypothetical protein [Gemmatimonadota bacterium]